MRCGTWDIGLCSWSLQTDLSGVIETAKRIGIDRLHLAVRGIDAEAHKAELAKHGIEVSCAMLDFPHEDYTTLDAIKTTGGVAPDACWDTSQQLFKEAAAATVTLGVNHLSIHAGFIDESVPGYAQKFKERIRTLADIAADHGLTLLLETGQESATDLKDFLEALDHPALAVNFDPANMILYDKDAPLEAVRILARWIRHLHIKDATRSTTPGTWGTEVPWGDGEVQAEAFLATLKSIGFRGVMAIEREAGNDRAGDIALAAERLADYQTIP